MSDPAMPLAPKLACRSVSLGAAVAKWRNANGATSAPVMVPRAARRVIGEFGFMEVLEENQARMEATSSP